MKKIIKISALLPVMAFATGCSDKDMSNDRLEGDFDVVMSLRTDATRAGENIDPYDAIDENRLYFATYDIDGSGTQKDWVYGGGNANTAINATYFTPTWGPSVSAKFKKEDYKNGFFTGIFSVPEYANKDFNIQGKNFADIANLTIKWPQTVAAGGSVEAWKPASDKDFPMAGVAKVSDEFLAKYIDHIHYNSPMNLPVTEMTRAMAKIVIVDEVEGGIIGKVGLESLLTGYITPQPAAWFNGTLVPYSPAAANNTFTQTLAAANAEVNGKPAYEFYTFERDFTGVAANNEARKIISLTAKDSYTMPDGLRNIKIAFTSYNGDKEVDSSSSSTGDWAGVLRNHVYTFHIYEPPTGGVVIEVTASPWNNHDKEDFDF
ncbi:MAG: hypothetical protein K2J03_05635 [Muribaculaceae bacterium]|nr:hypothetical protein [Muribaculaceae bacterium]